ncbi:MAG TPA: glycoside hydrolase family 18 protein [Chitinophagaceae bacterium]
MFLAILSIILISCSTSRKTTLRNNDGLTVTAYYAGGPEKVDSFDAQKITHIIHSFSRLEGNRLHVRTGRDSATIKKLVGLKKKNPQLKVLLGFGGWGGCETCSDVFASEENRVAFARSVKELGEHFGTDGIDLDWEYPALPSVPGHGYKPEDKQAFTALVQALRTALGPKQEISLAAGGFQRALDLSVEWGPVMQLADRVNLMTYDFTTGPRTGHNASLFSTPEQPLSADQGIRYLRQLGVPAHKIVIGAAFYARRWDSIPPVQGGLYQSGIAVEPLAFRDLDRTLPPGEGYERRWDSVAHAPYIYNARLQQFATYDDVRSVKEKTRYARQQGLNGIMFWQLAQDKPSGGLLQAIHEEKVSGDGR